MFVLAFGVFRASEVLSLEWEDVTFSKEGDLVIFLKCSKTDRLPSGVASSTSKDRVPLMPGCMYQIAGI